MFIFMLLLIVPALALLVLILVPRIDKNCLMLFLCFIAILQLLAALMIPAILYIDEGFFVLGVYDTYAFLDQAGVIDNEKLGKIKDGLYKDKYAVPASFSEGQANIIHPVMYSIFVFNIVSGASLLGIWWKLKKMEALGS